MSHRPWNHKESYMTEQLGTHTSRGQGRIQTLMSDGFPDDSDFSPEQVRVVT